MDLPAEILTNGIFKYVNNRLILSLVCKRWAYSIKYAYPHKNQIAESEYYLRIALQGHRRILQYLDPVLHSHIYRPTTEYTHVLKIATKLHTCKYYCWDQAVVNQAIQFCDTNYLSHLVERGWRIPEKAIILATVANNLNMINFLLENKYVDLFNRNKNRLFGKKAGETGNKDIINVCLKWFSLEKEVQCGLASGCHFDQITTVQDRLLLFYELAKVGNLDLIRKFNLYPTSKGVLAAAIHGHKDIVQAYPNKRVDSAHAIGEEGHFDILDILHENDQINKESFFIRIENHKCTGRLDVIKWYEKNIGPLNSYALIYASYNKDVEVFNYVRSKCVDTDRYFDTFIKVGSSNVAKCIIRENLSIGVSSLIKFARIKILDWVLEEYGEEARLLIQYHINKKISVKMIIWLLINGFDLSNELIDKLRSSNSDIAQYLAQKYKFFNKK